MEILLCTEQHAWLRLTAFTTFMPIVRAVINRLDVSAGILNVRPHASVNLLEIGLCHHTAINAGLVGDKNYSVVRLAEEPQCLKRAWKPFPLAPVPDVRGSRRLAVQDAVA